MKYDQSDEISGYFTGFVRPSVRLSRDVEYLSADKCNDTIT